MAKTVFAYIMLGALAMIINLSFILYTLCTKIERKRKKGVFRMVYLSLLVSNCALLLSPAIMYWSTKKENYGELWCILISYVDWVSTSVNVCSLLLISVDRFLAVMNPFRYVKLMKAGKVMGLQAVFIVWSFIMPHISNTSKKKFVYVKQLNFCLPTENRTLFHSWYLATFIFPATVAVFLNVFIIRYLVRRLKVFTEKRNTNSLMDKRQVKELSESGKQSASESGRQSDSNCVRTTFRKLSTSSWTTPYVPGQRRASLTINSLTVPAEKKETEIRKNGEVSLTQMIPIDELSKGCISVTGGNEIQPNPACKQSSGSRKLPNRQMSTCSMASGNFADKSILKHFDVVLRTISACVLEFVAFSVAWVTLYVVCAVAGIESCPVDVVVVILIHTTVTCVLYSASYTSYTKKKCRTKSALLRRYKYL